MIKRERGGESFGAELSYIKLKTTLSLIAKKCFLQDNVPPDLLWNKYNFVKRGEHLNAYKISVFFIKCRDCMRICADIHPAKIDF